MKQAFGFTLVELLVVIAVIGVLMGIAIVALNPARFRNQAQDGRRLSELSQISAALELYFADYGSYPASLADPNLPTLPTTDPDGVSYGYCPAGDNMTYNVCATLEVEDASTISDCSTGTISPCDSYSNPTTSCCLTNPF